jgi:TetR/AcrR family transcriptional regulator, tetracycline repressor protein
MRRLARTLGVEAMSLYHHVENKDDLLDACIEEVAASMDLSGMRAPGPWRRRLHAGFSAYRALAHAQPHLFALVGHRPVQRLEVLRPIEVALGVLEEAGFGPADRIVAFRTLNSYVYGYALSELGGLAIQTAAGPPADLEELPQLAQVLPIVRATDRDAEFARGLDTILDGISAWREASGSGQPT